MSMSRETKHELCVVLLGVMGVVYFGATFLAIFGAWFSGFGESPTELPHAAETVVFAASVLCQALTILFVAQAAAPVALRAVIIAVGVVVMVWSLWMVTATVGEWRDSGTSPTFWQGHGDSFGSCLAISACGPIAVYFIARATERTQRVTVADVTRQSR